MRTRGSQTGEQRRSGIVRRLTAPDGASRLASAEGDRKLMRGVRLVRRLAGVIGATSSMFVRLAKREPDRLLIVRSLLAGRSKPIGSATSQMARRARRGAGDDAGMTLSKDASGWRASGRQVRESGRPPKPTRRTVSEPDHSHQPNARGRESAGRVTALWMLRRSQPSEEQHSDE